MTRSEQRQAYSITSSARARSAGGTLSPSAFAVLQIVHNLPYKMTRWICYALIRENRRTHIEPRDLGNHPADGGQACAGGRDAKRGDEELRVVSHDHLSVAASAQEGRRRSALFSTGDGPTTDAERAPATASPQVDLRQGSTPIRVRLWFVDAADCCRDGGGRIRPASQPHGCRSTSG